MIGQRYWSTGITVQYGYTGHDWNGWAASLKFLDDGHADDAPGIGRISTEGTLATRYYVDAVPVDGAADWSDKEVADAHTAALTAVIDVLKRDAEALGIQFGRYQRPTVYGHGDGEERDSPLPKGWRELVNAQAARLGWEPAYGDAEVTA